MEEEKMQEEKITHIFNTTYNYIINTQQNGGRTFYKIPIKKKDYDGQQKTASILVKFAKGCEPVPNGTVIRIKNAMEDWYIKNRFDVILCLVIFNYEIVKRSDYAAEQAIQQFNNTDTSYEDDLPF